MHGDARLMRMRIDKIAIAANQIKKAVERPPELEARRLQAFL
jgi:hypothetical protein